MAEEEVHLYRAATASRTSLVFFSASAMWGEQQGGIYFRGRVIGLELWVQIGTADGRECFVVDAVLSMVGVVLSGGCKRSATHRTPFPLLVAAGLQWKGEMGRTDCACRKLYDLEMGFSSG